MFFIRMFQNIYIYICCNFAGCVTHSSESSKNVPPAKAWLVISGGDGYVDFRRQEIGAASISGGIREVRSGGSQHQPSHIIVWQLT